MKYILPEKEYIALGGYLKRKRIEAGLTQSEVAKTLGYTSQFVTNWENGRSNPPTNVLVTLIHVLKIDKEEFIEVLSSISLNYWRKALRDKRDRVTRKNRG
jgi:transcriptional regulator with XRE-family HTH domain